ncbi:response regulator transcription factor [Rubricoccus marinus]|uniref:OmpR/PhoB-type domain-containing protein n=1 Tax=Rubricoccus marinus TaxID=716817 RepID=A0A259TUA2_9BACT|nr:response regulator transcription factor [Rubricoccus marinus]OZC01280.1 hypothetical protein BSZ36_17690 [Rubricoccus marinus]
MPRPLRLDIVTDDTTQDWSSRWHPDAVARVSSFPETLAASGAWAVRLPTDLALIEWDVLRAPLFGAVCHAYRESGVPAVAMCADRDDALAAIVAGADRALLAPYPWREVQAGLIAYRRLTEAREGPKDHGILTVGRLAIDTRRARATVDGTVVTLTPRLFDLLTFLARREGEVVGREALLSGVWGLDFDPQTNAVDVYVHYLRRALRTVGLSEAVVTVRGRGYLFETL